MTETQDVVTADQRAGLDIAAQLISAGIPVFAAEPCPAAHGGQCSRDGHNGREEYHLPPQWQKTVPSRVWLERWKPGWALAAVGGHTADVLDEDPRNGGDRSMTELVDSGQMPRVYGVAETPSGGRHYLIAPLGERKGELMPGIDYQGGAPDGQGRGFVWIAPTVKRSKSIDHGYERRPYVWSQLPDTDWLTEGGDESGSMIVARLAATRARRAERGQDDRQARVFTEAQARSFVQPMLDKVMTAEIGGIETAANNAAAVLSHFVPHIWDAEFAHAVLMAALAETAYDPNHPGAGWTADKFWAVLRGENGRAPGDWRAELKVEAEQALAAVEPDAVDALLDEMKHPAEMVDLAPPKHLVRGLLTLDSESWIIGAPGSKKSFVALDIAGHVARGLDWQGLKVTQGRVVMIVAEGSAGTGKRLRAWQKQYGDMDPASDTVFILPRPVQSARVEAWAVLVKACERLKPTLVIIDTQARVTVGLKENDATDMGIYVEAQRAIRAATGACVLTVHHTGRAGGDARGSSALDGAQGTELKVESTGPLRGRLITDKQKDIEEAPPLPLFFNRLELGEDEDGQTITSLVLVEEDVWAKREVELAREPEPGQAVELPEPPAWTHVLVEHNKSHVKRYILTVLHTVGAEAGLSEAKVEKIICDRWFGGRPKKSGRPGHLDTTTWSDAWTGVQLLEHAGELVVVRQGSGRLAINPSAIPQT